MKTSFSICVHAVNGIYNATQTVIPTSWQYFHNKPNLFVIYRVKQLTLQTPEKKK